MESVDEKVKELLAALDAFVLGVRAREKWYETEETGDADESAEGI